MQSIFKIFQTLNNEIPTTEDSFAIANLPQIKNHKIGISENGLPLFFIKCEDIGNQKSLDYNLESISIQFNKKCQLLSNDKKNTEGIYTIIALKTNTIDLQEYFLNILYLVVSKLPTIVKLNELKIEVEKLINLFNKFTKLPTKTIQGLWAELLVIEQSNTPEYIIKTWHYSSTDKFDFNDGKDKIEVKSTTKNRRIHTFSSEQLNPNKNSRLIIASVFAIQTGQGKTIFDLIKLIDDRIKNNELLFRINEVLLDTLGQDFEKAFEIYFDYHFAVDSLAYFDGELIPKIETSSIRPEISNIHFDCDLSKVEKLGKINYNSLLHKSLIK